MRITLPGKASLALASIGLILVTACQSDAGRTRDDMARGAEGTDTGMAGGDTRTDTSAARLDTGGDLGDLTDANIVALLDEANKADSAAGALALTRATNPEVKRFAKLMTSEHHALRVEGLNLAKKLGVTPTPPANDPVRAAADREMQALRSAQGAEFDRVYIDQEVAFHEAVIDLAEQAHESADNPELKALIEKAKPTLEKHLDEAKAIQEKLKEGTT